MSANQCLRSLVLATLTVFITGCCVIPVPGKKTLVSGDAVAEEEVRSKVSVGEDLFAVKSRLGEPIMNLGPQRVYVYMWAVRKGTIVIFPDWFMYPLFGFHPWTASHLMFIAFDMDGKVLKAGTANFKQFDTIAEQVHEWLSSNSLASQVISPRLGQSTTRAPTLLIYRPSKSPCSFPTFDSNTYKPSVAVDGIVVGDLAKGEYLASEISEGAHEITIDPVPHYRFLGMEKSFYVQDVRGGRIPATLRINRDSDQPIFIETYSCTGLGQVEMHAVIRDTASALKAIRVLQPAW